MKIGDLVTEKNGPYVIFVVEKILYTQDGAVLALWKRYAGGRFYYRNSPDNLELWRRYEGNVYLNIETYFSKEVIEHAKIIF